MELYNNQVHIKFCVRVSMIKISRNSIHFLIKLRQERRKHAVISNFDPFLLTVLIKLKMMRLSSSDEIRR